MQTPIFARNLALTALLAGSLGACGTESPGTLQVAAHERAAELAADPDAAADAGDLFLLLMATAEPDHLGDRQAVDLRTHPVLPAAEAPHALVKSESEGSADDQIERRQGLRASTSPDPAPEIDDGDSDSAEKEEDPCKGPFARLCGASPSPTRVEYRVTARSAVPVSTSAQ